MTEMGAERGWWTFTLADRRVLVWVPQTKLTSARAVARSVPGAVSTGRHDSCFHCQGYKKYYAHCYTTCHDTQRCALLTVKSQYSITLYFHPYSFFSYAILVPHRSLLIVLGILLVFFNDEAASCLFVFAIVLHFSSEQNATRAFCSCSRWTDEPVSLVFRPWRLSLL